MAISTRARPASSNGSAPTTPTTRVVARPVGPVRRVQIPWLVAAVAALLLATLLVLVGLSRAADRTRVLSVSRPIAAGEVVTADALAVRAIAIDGGPSLFVVEGHEADVVGKVAVKPLAVGELLTSSDVASTPELVSGERRVGAVVKPTRVPPGAHRGGVLSAFAVDGDRSTLIPARVLDVAVAKDGTATLGLAVASDQAPVVAQWAASDRLVLVGEPG